MPVSSLEGKDIVKSFVTSTSDIYSVLDVGPGVGTYRTLLTDTTNVLSWTAIEAWFPYVQQFNLSSIYDKIIVDDARRVDWGNIGTYDLVIFGDVLEHMSKSDAIALFNKATRISRYIIVSMPIIHYPQDAVGGNPFEAHIHHWTADEIRNDLIQNMNIVTSKEYDITGVYIVDTKEAR